MRTGVRRRPAVAAHVLYVLGLLEVPDAELVLAVLRQQQLERRQAHPLVHLRRARRGGRRLQKASQSHNRLLLAKNYS